MTGLQIALLLTLTGAQTAQAMSFPSDPLAAEIHRSDVDLFWQAFDVLRSDPEGNPFQELYLDSGTPGLRDFVPEQRIQSAEALREMVLQEMEYYENIRASSIRVGQYEKQIRAAYYALKYWYPKAVFPPVYFVIGRTTSGGTASSNGLIIGTEVFAAAPFRTTYGRPSFDIDYVPFTVAHEIVHFLQRDYEGPATLLRECIREGSADFIGELIAGEKVKKLNGERLYEYGDQHEQRLLQQFMEQKDSVEFPLWLYGQTKDGRPQNLGYWMGYQIVESLRCGDLVLRRVILKPLPFLREDCPALVIPPATANLQIPR